MAEATSPTTGRRYGVASVCRVWDVPRSSFYAAQEAETDSAATAVGPARRGPKPSTSDEALLAAIRADLERSPWTGEGHRKVLCGRPREAKPTLSSCRHQAAQAKQPGGLRPASAGPCSVRRPPESDPRGPPRGHSKQRRLRRSPIRVGERSGQVRSYVRPVVRRPPPAIMGVRLRARHHSGRRARGTSPCSAWPGLSRPQPFPSRRPALAAGSSGPSPALYHMRRNVTPSLPRRPRRLPSPGRPRRAPSAPRRCAPSCSPAPP
jgi:hypothetical protein